MASRKQTANLRINRLVRATLGKMVEDNTSPATRKEGYDGHRRPGSRALNGFRAEHAHNLRDYLLAKPLGKERPLNDVEFRVVRAACHDLLSDLGSDPVARGELDHRGLV